MTNSMQSPQGILAQHLDVLLQEESSMAFDEPTNAPDIQNFAPPVLEIKNVVSTVDLSCPLNLQDIARRASNTEYNPAKFPALFLRIREPKTTALVSASGKVVVLGATNEAAVKTAAQKFAKAIKSLDYPVHFKDYIVRNIVAIAQTNRRINLYMLQLDHAKFATFDPEIFPGLIYHMEDSRITILMFTSGKIVIAGAKCTAALYTTMETIWPLIRLYSSPMC